MKILIALILVCLATGTAVADTVYVRDNLNRLVAIERDGAAAENLSPSVLSTASAFVASSSEPITGYSPSAWDIELTFGASGNNDGETLVGFGLMKLLGNFGKFGISGVRNQDGTVTVGTPLAIWINPRPFTSAKPYIGVNWGGYGAGGFTLAPTAGLGFEFPIEQFAVKVAAGAQYVFIEQDVDINDFGGLVATGTFVYRMR